MSMIERVFIYSLWLLFLLLNIWVILLYRRVDSKGNMKSTADEGSSIFMPSRDRSMVLGTVLFKLGTMVISFEYHNKTEYNNRHNE